MTITLALFVTNFTLGIVNTLIGVKDKSLFHIVVGIACFLSASIVLAVTL